MKPAKTKTKRIGIFNRIFKFRSAEERLLMQGTQEYLDIPPGSHHFACDGHCRVSLFTDAKTPRTTYVFKQGRWRIVVPGDVLISVQCAENITWQFDLAIAAEKVDSTRVEVPLEIQAKNKAHSNLRYMIERFMRGKIIIDKTIDDDGSDDESFDVMDHPYTRYEQAVIDEEVEKAQKAAQPPSSTSPSPGATEQPAPGAPQPGEVK